MGLSVGKWAEDTKWSWVDAGIGKVGCRTWHQWPCRSPFSLPSPAQHHMCSSSCWGLFGQCAQPPPLQLWAPPPFPLPSHPLQQLMTRVQQRGPFLVLLLTRWHGSSRTASAGGFCKWQCGMGVWEYGNVEWWLEGKQQHGLDPLYRICLRTTGDT